jgi:hypothetical protein
MKFSQSSPRVLTFDIEARPMAWYGGDFVTKQITAVAWAWGDGRVPGPDPAPYEVPCRTLRDNGMVRMLQEFRKVYEVADLVTGHYIKGFDLPLIQSWLSMMDMPLLDQKLASDTKNDLIKMHGVSKSMENLASQLGCESEKFSMTTTDWLRANALEEEGTKKLVARVTSDVVLHIEMRGRMLAKGMLKPPSVWKPTAAVGGYVA